MVLEVNLIQIKLNTQEKMKKLMRVLLMLFAFHQLVAQVAIGKTGTTNNSVLLEFGSDAKGIIVPQVNSSTGAAGGTFVFNSADRSMEVWEGRNNSNSGGWTNLTADNISTPPVLGLVHSYINSGADVIASSGSGVIIGAASTTKKGALVLESSTKAMVLPLVSNPHINLKGAIAGTMVYDTVSGMLAVYDGISWSYWK